MAKTWQKAIVKSLFSLRVAIFDVEPLAPRRTCPLLTAFTCSMHRGLMASPAAVLNLKESLLPRR